ncbi:MAG TPA: hypothetical protein DCR43_08750 [Bacteroidales bacterium]|nr:MAG: hypothetical protein A2X11_04375 [Bacteroidetes bacterium GWE2_42_24]OFY25236.1 MAG: hypothetical protein A2X09_10920 [Bacteroidetes bacterium GWF2_43_11]HAQ65922.1 hypothetical protein [Bacteroidales bacterium]HBZ66937.1 hypothetical protein [Bacteroidales bacterium]
MWLGARDYSQGVFHEPRFYGQAYNTMLEALVAVPFLQLGMPIFKALPVATTLLALVPVFILSIVTYIRNSKIAGIIVLCVFLTLPVEYSMLTTLSRGFVTGVAFASLSFLFLYKYNSRVSFFFVFLISVVAYSINANSILLTIPTGLVFFLKNYMNRQFYLFSIIGFLAGLAIHLLIAQFYIDNPYYNLHTYHSELSIDSLVKGMLNLDKFFNYITPVFWHNGWLILPLFFLIAFVLYRRKDFDLSFVALIIPIIVVGTLLLSKVHDGSDSVFFSYARMYLAVPVLLMLMLSFIRIQDQKWMYGFIIMSIVFFGINIATSKEAIEKNMKNKHVIIVLPTDLLQKECSELQKISDNNNVNLIVIVNHYFYDVYDYGCPSCMQSFPKTIRPEYERRTWRLIEDENKVYTNILIIDLAREYDKEFDFINKVKEKQGMYLLKNNTLCTKLLYEKLSINVRKYN